MIASLATNKTPWSFFWTIRCSSVQIKKCIAYESKCAKMAQVILIKVIFSYRFRRHVFYLQWPSSRMHVVRKTWMREWLTNCQHKLEFSSHGSKEKNTVNLFQQIMLFRLCSFHKWWYAASISYFNCFHSTKKYLIFVHKRLYFRHTKHVMYN